jgi:hypothetical protein
MIKSLAVLLVAWIAVATLLLVIHANGQDAEPAKPVDPMVESAGGSVGPESPTVEPAESVGPTVEPLQDAGLGFGGGFQGGASGSTNVALGIPESAIPGRKWIASARVIVAFSDDGKLILAYSEQHPRWVPHELTRINGRSVVPVLGDTASAVWHGNRCYAYSPILGTWDASPRLVPRAARLTCTGGSVSWADAEPSPAWSGDRAAV